MRWQIVVALLALGVMLAVVAERCMRPSLPKGANDVRVLHRHIEKGMKPADVQKIAGKPDVVQQGYLGGDDSWVYHDVNRKGYVWINFLNDRVKEVRWNHLDLPERR